MLFGVSRLQLHHLSQTLTASLCLLVHALSHLKRAKMVQSGAALRIHNQARRLCVMCTAGTQSRAAPAQMLIPLNSCPFL